MAIGSGVKLPDNKNDCNRMMHCLPCGNGVDQTAKSSRAIGICCAMTISGLSTTGVLEEWEGGRQAKVGEKVRPWLQHMGALRPGLSIAAMIKIKMVAVESEVMGPSTGSV